jgi:hypothetical protein
MDRSVAIIQSNYIPWKGYFDIIKRVDEFILFDEAQYTVRDWRNRNQIKTASGVQWLSIPVNVKGKRYQKISETTISRPDWAIEHWKTLQHNYARAPYFKDYRSFFEDLYKEALSETHLSKINYLFLKAICDLLDIKTSLTWSSDYQLLDGKTDRLIGLCQQVNAKVYLSGPSARNYLDEQLFFNTGMRVEWMDYSGYPVYSQQFPPFSHAVSIIDLIFNEGPNAARYMKSIPASPAKMLPS